jgi:hypothetical protein
MKEYLQKRMYVYRKSYKYFLILKICSSFGKALFATSALGGIVLPPLFAIIPLSVLIEILDNQFNTTVKLNERIEEYKSSYKFYSELLHLFNAKKSTEIEINLLEKDFINNLKYFPVEKYLMKMGLNGY